MGDHGAGETALRAMLGVEGRQLSLKGDRQIGNGESLPAADVAGTRAGHQCFDRTTGRRCLKVGKLHPRGDTDAGAIGADPDFSPKFIDGSRRADRYLNGQSCSRRGIENESLAGGAASCRHRTAVVRQQVGKGVGRSQRPGRLMAVAGIVNHGSPAANDGGCACRRDREHQRVLNGLRRKRNGGHGRGPKGGKGPGFYHLSPCRLQISPTYLPRFPELRSFSPCSQRVIVESEQAVRCL